jgi:anaerobic selenocysteine-containing dehydrogenase
MTVELRKTACNRDCPDACGLVAEVEEGRVTALRGDRDHPVTRGFLCLRTSRYPAIFHYRSGGSLGILKHLTDLFFDRFGPCVQKRGDICSGAGEAAQVEDFGVCDSNAQTDLRNSRHILLWGKNPAVSSVHLVPLLRECRQAGAKVTLVDPVHQKSAALADRVLQPAPGRDLELAMGVAHVLISAQNTDPNAPDFCEGLEGFQQLARQRSAAEWAGACGLSVEDLRHLASTLVDGPTAILVGWGLQRRLRGAATVRALDALSAISGNLFRPGGGCSFYFRRRRPFSAFEFELRAPRWIREPCFAEDLLAADPPIRLCWITAGNPVAMLPDSQNVARALDRTEFVVVADCLRTETVEHADLVLPVPSLLEDDDLLGSYGHHGIVESRPVVEPPPGVMHEAELFQELARRLSVDFPMGSIDSLKQQALADVAEMGAGLEDLRKSGGFLQSPLARDVLFTEGRVETPSGRVRLLQEVPEPPQLAAPPARAGESGPLWLFSNSTEKSQASVWVGDGPGDHITVVVGANVLPGSADGCLVRVRSATGEIAAVLRRDPRQRDDVAIVPKGGSLRSGQAANALVAARPTDMGLGAAYLDCLVRIGPL